MLAAPASSDRGQGDDPLSDKQLNRALSCEAVLVLFRRGLTVRPPLQLPAYCSSTATVSGSIAELRANSNNDCCVSGTIAVTSSLCSHSKAIAFTLSREDRSIRVAHIGLPRLSRMLGSAPLRNKYCMNAREACHASISAYSWTKYNAIV